MTLESIRTGLKYVENPSCLSFLFKPLCTLLIQPSATTTPVFLPGCRQGIFNKDPLVMKKPLYSIYFENQWNFLSTQLSRTSRLGPWPQGSLNFPLDIFRKYDSLVL